MLPPRALGEASSCFVQLLVVMLGWWLRLCPRGHVVSSLRACLCSPLQLLLCDLPLTTTPAESLLPRKLTGTRARTCTELLEAQCTP